jgi:hypothetical protein
MGINDVELSGYYGKTVKEFKKLLDRSKINCGSMIFGYDVFEKDPGTIIRDVKLSGAKDVGFGRRTDTKSLLTGNYKFEISFITSGKLKKKHEK